MAGKFHAPLRDRQRLSVGGVKCAWKRRGINTVENWDIEDELNDCEKF